MYDKWPECVAMLVKWVARVEKWVATTGKWTVVPACFGRPSLQRTGNTLWRVLGGSMRFGSLNEIDLKTE